MQRAREQRRDPESVAVGRVADENVQRQVAVNLTGTFNGMREGANRVRNGGRSINLSTSTCSQRNSAPAASPAAAKGHFIPFETALFRAAAARRTALSSGVIGHPVPKPRISGSNVLNERSGTKSCTTAATAPHNRQRASRVI
jgi:NAD(P)-dependent dehydrogenase (short-subunit alcohol dehydrogenase family)